VAEPGSLIGFLGPRVFEAIYGEKFPENVQTGENLHKMGIVDAVIGPERIAGTVSRVLDVLMGAQEVPSRVPNPDTAPDTVDPNSDAWAAITSSRRPERPGVRDLLRTAANTVLPLN